jgi:hypothetical protein
MRKASLAKRGQRKATPATPERRAARKERSSAPNTSPAMPLFLQSSEGEAVQQCTCAQQADTIATIEPETPATIEEHTAEEKHTAQPAETAPEETQAADQPAALEGPARSAAHAAEAEEREAGPSEEAGDAEAETAPEDEPHDVASRAMSRIGAAPPSPIASAVAEQAELINSESDAAHVEAVLIAEERRATVSGHFGAARESLSGFVEDNIAASHSFIADKRSEASEAAAGAVTSVQDAVTGALQSAQEQGARVAGRISAMIDTANESVQAGVGGIVGRINNVIDSVPLPDLPGVGRNR